MASFKVFAELVPGDEVAGKYRLEKEIGKGAMGVVYQAEHLVLNERVALKFIQKFEDEGRRERFLREARTGARLRSEHSVRVLDVGSLPQGQHFLVMELLSGHNLKDVLKTQGPLPIDEAVDHVIQACDALAEAHLLGIVHRDIKPANLFLITRSDGSPLIKVLDFGVAKHSVPGSEELTASNDLVGSPAYMSPEQLRSPRHAEPAADIWSLGVVLHELLVGRRPFGGETTAELILAICGSEPALAHRARPEIPEALGQVIRSCLQREPEQRLASVAALAERLLPFSSSSYSRVVVERLQKLDFSRQPRHVESATRMPAVDHEAALTSTSTDTSSQDERSLVAVTSQHAIRLAAPPTTAAVRGELALPPRSPLRRRAPWLALAGTIPFVWLALGPSRFRDSPTSDGFALQSSGLAASAAVRAAVSDDTRMASAIPPPTASPSAASPAAASALEERSSAAPSSTARAKGRGRRRYPLTSVPRVLQNPGVMAMSSSCHRPANEPTQAPARTRHDEHLLDRATHGIGVGRRAPLP